MTKLITPLLRGSLLLGAALSFGCADTEGQFEEFVGRYEEINPSSGSGTLGGPCTPPAAGEIDGNYLFTLAASIKPERPLLFDTQLTTADGASGLEFSMDLQPLDRFDRTTPQGPVIPIGPFAIDAQGKFSTLLPPLDVTGDANPISGSDISATVSIEGFICTMTESICGTAEGDVTKPVPLPIAGSTFTIEKLAGPGMYPDPPILDCEGTEAGPPPSP